MGAPTSKGCCLSIGELCCCAGTCKSATCCDDDGCVASTSKCCCCLAHGEVPPSNTPGVGCGPAMLCAKWNEDSTNPYEQEEMSLLKSTCGASPPIVVCLVATRLVAPIRAASRRGSCVASGRTSKRTRAATMVGSNSRPSRAAVLPMHLTLPGERRASSVAIIRCVAGTCQRRRRAQSRKPAQWCAFENHQRQQAR